jgi:WS/DGAT/MGAT family acyltransferase
MSRGIPPLDLMFLLAERDTQPSHVAALMVFAPPPRAPRDYVARLVASYREIAPRPPYNFVPSIPLVGRPAWRESACPDMRYHVSHLALPRPGRREQLWELVEDLHAVGLDRRQPLFRVRFIEGLEGGRFAMYAQIHHAIVDGVSGLARTMEALNDAPRRREVRAIYGVEAPRGGRPQTRSEGTLLRAVAGGRRQARALGHLAAFAARRIGGLLAQDAGGDAPEGSRLFSSPRLPTNRPFAARRSFAAFTVPATEIDRVRRALGGTVNDVAMAIVDAGLTRYLADHGSPPAEPIVCMCPVSLRDEDDAEASIKVSAVFVPMGEPRETAARRLARISRNAAAAKAEMKQLTADAALDLAVALYAAQEGAIALGVNALPPTANLVLSNMRFAEKPVYLGDARLEAFYPVSMIGGGIGLNVTFVSYDGRLDFGLVASRSAIPDIERLARALVQAFEELKRAARRRTARKSAPRSTGPRPAQRETKN